MNEEAFCQLLSCLHSDPAQAGEEYEKLRTGLIGFFERKGCRVAAELGDETINRIARRIAAGCKIKNLFKYSYGVARLVLLEHWDDPKRDWEQLDEQILFPESDPELDDPRLHCMNRCLQSLPEEDRNLITRHCLLDKSGKEGLAETLGLTMNALRLRVFRIRAKLLPCYRKCIKNM